MLQSVCSSGATTDLPSASESAYSDAFLDYFRKHEVLYEAGLGRGKISDGVRVLAAIFAGDRSEIRRPDGNALPDYTRNFFDQQEAIRIGDDERGPFCAFILHGAAVVVYFDEHHVLFAHYLEE